ncbi:TonB-dependent receptor family protein [Rubrivirga sp. S365]|uniref:TonB-dependent receptor family protein n=1 Tax=Rubrivirga litoralis TaxID=3075598 RepID=A0ABU3BPE3_9BACT|nr:MULTISPECIES: TonB-dependent receptor family protein [unclassified Rubrivirga]MDT0631157.1 TonB-dependent receptor family protein [Rubrivirga sp. F394]MDT7856700.1 TonB-dependent receptor family protein [Rubrivirga sp. S365]
MARLLFAALLLAAAPLAAAQTGTLTARVVDAESDQPLPTATVALYPAGGADSTFAGGAAADIDGNVRVTDLAVGTYDVVVSFVGYDDARRADVEVGAGGADLGTVGLEPSAEALAEVQVTGRRPQVQTRIDRTVYDTADDPVAEGGSAVDVLATLPSVDVDIDGNVSLRGAGSVAVFVNGRPAPVSGDFVASYLASLPAGSIERVEVIPNPSAAFEPDGVGGIINIVLKDDADLGLGGTVTAGADTQGGYDGTVALTYGRGPWSLAGTYGYRNDARAGSGTSFRINRYEAAATTLDQEEVEDRTRTSHLVNLSADYSVSRATTLTSQFQVGTRGGDEVETNTTLRRSASGDPLLEYERISEELDDGLSFDARLGLLQTFGEGHRLTVEGRGEVSDEGEDQRYSATLLGGAGALDAPQRVDEDETERELSLQVDYTRPLGAFRLDAGYKGEFEAQSSTLVSESLAEGGAYVPDADVNNQFDYDQTVHALYAQVAAERGPWGAQAGLRFEQAQTTFFLLTTDEAFDNDYASLFPSAFLSFAPSEATTLKASYSRRINRPRTWSLNPFPSFDDPLNVRQGNPALQPEYVDAFELGVTHVTGWGSVSLTPYARRTTDIIRRISTVRDDGVTVRTFENLDTSDSYGAEFVTSFEDVGGLGGYLSLEAFRLQTEGTTADADLSNDAFGWGGRLNASYGLGDRTGLGDLDLQATARYSAPLDTEQGRVGARTFIDVALRQKLLDDRAALTLQLRDPLGLAGFSYTLDQPALYQQFERDWGAQQIGLTFSYQFGRQEARREERGRGGDFEGEEF